MLGILWQTATKLALPAIFVALIIDMVLGVLARAASQINAYFLSLPAKMIGGIALVFFMLPFLIDDFANSGFLTLTH